MLRFEDVSVKFGSCTVLSDVSFTLSTGKLTALVGKNGSGKTTILKIVNDLLTASGGEVLVCGNKVGVQSKQPLQPNPLQGRENKPAASTGGDWLRNAIAAGNQK